MKVTSYIFFFFSFFLFSCEDTCDYYRSYTINHPIYSSMESLRDSVDFIDPIDIVNPGKLNYNNGYLFISETRKGIHVIDNRNINNPLKIGFLVLPGNYDIATKGDYLYADSYIDLVVFDISDKNNIKEVNRLLNNFENYYINNGLYDLQKGIIVGYEDEIREEKIENHDCNLAYD